jgi:hypothetical protein
MPTLFASLCRLHHQSISARSMPVLRERFDVRLVSCSSWRVEGTWGELDENEHVISICSGTVSDAGGCQLLDASFLTHNQLRQPLLIRISIFLRTTNTVLVLISYFWLCKKKISNSSNASI